MSRRVSDLRWVIGSPPICAPTSRWASAEQGRRELAEHRQWLSRIDPAELDAFVNSTGSRRLGLYFETLHAFWFARSPHRTLLADHVPIRREKHTLGELDFVYQDADGPVHCEIAVKFYLRVGADHGLAGYVGPSLRDRFDWKLDKIAGAQSRRLELPETRRALAELGIEPEGLRTEIRLKGVLFEPVGTGTARPEPVDSECLSGTWTTREALSRGGHPTDGWHVLDRLEWLSGPGRDRPAVQLDTVQELLRLHPRPVQLCRAVDGRIERRLFIVPENWRLEAEKVAAGSPNRAAALQW